MFRASLAVVLVFAIPFLAGRVIAAEPFEAQLRQEILEHEIIPMIEDVFDQAISRGEIQVPAGQTTESTRRQAVDVVLETMGPEELEIRIDEALSRIRGLGLEQRYIVYKAMRILLRATGTPEANFATPGQIYEEMFEYVYGPCIGPYIHEDLSGWTFPDGETGVLAMPDGSTLEDAVRYFVERTILADLYEEWRDSLVRLDVSQRLQVYEAFGYVCQHRAGE